MSELPHTEFIQRVRGNIKGPIGEVAHMKDALLAVDELLARIAAMETENEVLRLDTGEQISRAVQAEAALAERERMLDLACVNLARDSKEWHEQRDSYDTGYDAAYFLADLRARAEKTPPPAEAIPS